LICQSVFHEVSTLLDFVISFQDLRPQVAVDGATSQAEVGLHGITVSDLRNNKVNDFSSWNFLADQSYR